MSLIDSQPVTVFVVPSPSRESQRSWKECVVNLLAEAAELKDCGLRVHSLIGCVRHPHATQAGGWEHPRGVLDAK